MLGAGERVGEFEIPDLEGRRVRPLEWAGDGRLLIAVVKDDCPTCRLTLPYLERVHRRLGGGTPRIVSVSQDDPDRSRSFAAEMGLTFPVVVDAPGYAVSGLFGIEFVPSLFIVDRHGLVHRALTGFLKAGIEDLASDLAASMNAPRFRVFDDADQVPILKPG